MKNKNLKLKKTFFLIIIPAYNKKEIIKKTLIYLKKLNYPKNKYEVIVVENSSTDNTFKEVKKFESNNLKIFHIEKKGISIERNNGIKKASKNSEGIIFLDANTFLKENFFNELSNYILKHPKKSYETTYIFPILSTLKDEIVHFSLINNGDYLFKYLHKIHIVKKNILKKFRYEENISSTEDIIFSKDLSKAGRKYFCILTNDVLSSTRRWT